MGFNREEEEPNEALSTSSEKPEGSCHVEPHISAKLICFRLRTTMTFESEVSWQAYCELRSYHSDGR